jgi:hypothetical protein
MLIRRSESSELLQSSLDKSIMSVWIGRPIAACDLVGRVVGITKSLSIHVPRVLSGNETCIPHDIEAWARFTMSASNATVWILSADSVLIQKRLLTELMSRCAIESV